MSPSLHASQRWTIDPEFRSLCPPLSSEEYQQLETNILAEGCRDPLVVWEEEGLLLDGHNRQKICEEHAITPTHTLLSLASREDAVEWIIANQFGRRNLTPEDKSYLRGKRFQNEKRRVGRPQKQPHNEAISGKTSQHLAAEYGVAHATIERDEQFAAAVDTLEQQVRADIRAVALKHQQREKQQATKKQVTRAGKLIAEKTVEPLPFMQRQGWKPYHILQAIDILGTLPPEEHATLNTFLDHPFIPAEQGLLILTNLQQHALAQRQHLYTLAASADPREQSLALTLAAQKVPEPDPQFLLAGNLIKAVEDIRERQRRNWRLPYATEPWIATLEAIDATLATVQDQWRSIMDAVKASHQERIASHAEVFDPSR